MSEGSRSSLERAVRALLLEAAEVYSDDPAARATLRRQLDRLDEPLRVAIAGKMKSGKSTLLNALVGEEIAPTDAGECTRVVVWYSDGARPRLTLHRVSAEPVELPIHRVDGRLELDLAGHQPEEVERLSIEWPSRSLRAINLIDTPGIDSLSAAVSQRTMTFLTPQNEPSSADAMIYLLRHAHASDLRFLEAFHDRGVGRATMVNTIGVLSRADEVGAGRIDSLISARGVAERYREHPVIRQLCSTVVPLAGLLAQASRTLRQSEYAALEVLAQQPRSVTDAMLLSVNRFIAPTAPVPVSADDRSALLDRLGLFGTRLALTFVRSGMRDSTALSQELVRRSGLNELRTLLTTQFTERSGLLKARSSLLAVTRLIRRHPRHGTEAIEAQVERILAGSHEFRELALLGALRASRVSFAPFGTDATTVAERLLGGDGTAASQRLGLAESATDADVYASTVEAVRIWRGRAESPLIDRQTAAACHVVARSCEGILSDL